MNTNDHLQAVVFDIDGTLFDTLPSLAAAANHVLLEAGLHAVSEEALRPALSEGLLSMFRKALQLQSLPVDARLTGRFESDCMAEYVRNWLPTAPLFAGVADTLKALKSRGLRVAVCTNRDRASTEILLASASITDLFEVIVGLGDAPSPKPAAAPLLLALERLSIPVTSALFVGDSAIDARCAQLSDVRFAAHRCGYSGHPADLLPNVLAFDDYDQLRNWAFDNPTCEDACHV